MELRNPDFFRQTALEGAPLLVGKLLCRNIKGEIIKLRITETECYMGEEDKACHACKGKTPRTSVLYEAGGIYYVYLIYGLHWLLNVVFGQEGIPQAVLIRCCKAYEGPAKLTKILQVDKAFNRESALTSDKLWLEDDGCKPEIITLPRVGIDYAGEYWKNVPWRFKARTE
ncbi:MAG: DNA-3-methyladenine glycosylase [Oscillospiraceae bacterium]|jgi:DNA-3-methyladenine glycosylase|nr:DNA-3-methyladenine glycosylase [Oscillospiraceae bacterium]